LSAHEKTKTKQKKNEKTFYLNSKAEILGFLPLSEHKIWPVCWWLVRQDTVYIRDSSLKFGLHVSYGDG